MRSRVQRTFFYSVPDGFWEAHGNLTLAWFSSNPVHCVRRFQRSSCDYEGVSLSPLHVLAHRIPRFRFTAACSSLFLKTGVTAHVPLGSLQKESYPYHLCCDAVILHRFLFQRTNHFIKPILFSVQKTSAFIHISKSSIASMILTTISSCSCRSMTYWHSPLGLM